MRLGRLLKKIHMLRCTRPPRSNSCLWFVVVLVQISRSRFTDTITRNVRLASEIFLSNLQERVSALNAVVQKGNLAC
jgi:hypothetical protein